jgi:hypothetical protein
MIYFNVVCEGMNCNGGIPGNFENKTETLDEVNNHAVNVEKWNISLNEKGNVVSVFYPICFAKKEGTK